MLFWSSCSTKRSDERQWLERFFKGLLLEEEPGAMFTLWGTKPMSLILIYHYTANEMIAHYTHLTDAEKTKLKQDLANYDFPENWNRWEQIKHHFPSNHFLLFKNTATSDDKVSDIWLVNIAQTARVLRENYASFRTIVGFDFDPQSIIHEIEQPQSTFWNTALNHPALLGILFGYGPDNAWPFYWKYTSATIDLPHTFSTDTRPSPITLDTLPIPTFAIFHDTAIVAQYNQEKRIIQQMYKGKDFLETTLKQFSSKGAPSLVAQTAQKAPHFPQLMHFPKQRSIPTDSSLQSLSKDTPQMPTSRS